MKDAAEGEEIATQINAKEAPVSKAKASTELDIPDPDKEEAAKAILNNLVGD